MPMRMTEEGLALIMRFEGFRAEAYRCPAGVWTIGYGHTSAAGPPAVRPSMRWSERQARQVLEADVAQFAEGVRASLTRAVSDAQFSALVSFAYNVGLSAFRGSSVLEAVNGGRFEAVPDRLRLWVKAGGRVLPGLENRRAAEARLFMSDTPRRSGKHLAAGAAAAAAAAAAATASSGWPVWMAVLLPAVLGAVLIWFWLRRRKAQGGGG